MQVVQKASQPTIQSYQTSQDTSEMPYELAFSLLQECETTTDSPADAIQKALPYLERASEQGNPKADYLLYKLHKGELRIEPNSDQAGVYLERLQKSCYQRGCSTLSRQFESVQDAISYLTISAEHGFAPASFLLGEIYLDGHGYGSIKNLASAKKYLELALTQGHPNAARMLALHFPTIDQLHANMLSAEEAHAEGLRQLRFNTPEANQKAIIYFEKAAEAGLAKACNSLDAIFRMGVRAETNLKKADQYRQRAADLGKKNNVDANKLPTTLHADTTTTKNSVPNEIQATLGTNSISNQNSEISSTASQSESDELANPLVTSGPTVKPEVTPTPVVSQENSVPNGIQATLETDSISNQNSEISSTTSQSEFDEPVTPLVTSRPTVKPEVTPTPVVSQENSVLKEVQLNTSNDSLSKRDNLKINLQIDSDTFVPEEDGIGIDEYWLR